MAHAFSRHGLIAITKGRSAETTRTTLVRSVSLLLGSTFIGLGVSFFVHARLGLPPYDVMLSATSRHLGVTYGQAAWMMSAVLFSVATMLGQRPKMSGLAYVIANGFAVDIALSVVNDAQSLGLRIVFAGLGFGAIVAGVSLVVHSGLTGGAFELLMNAGSERGFDPIRVRTGLEIAILAAGIGLSGDFGIATVGFALLVGPTMRIFYQALHDHRHGRQNRMATS